MPSTFHDVDVKSNLKNRRKLSAFLDGLVTSFKISAQKIRLTYIFCNDEYLLKINQQFLNHDTLTDVITFDLSEVPETLILGEIYISIDRVKENAKEFSTNYDEELLRVIFHGALHLCGKKDKTEQEQAIMRTLEQESIVAYKLQLK